MNNLSLLESTIGIKFKNKKLVKNAFIHCSYLNEHKSLKISSNEKLEFLGDSVLALITTIYLYKNYPQLNEGDYTDIKSALVKTESLYQAAYNLRLGNYLYLSKGQEKNQGRRNRSILADCFEALLGAIFLDQGFETAFQFVNKFLFKGKIDPIISHHLYRSAKNKLQEYLQGVYKKLPRYLIVNEAGPDHNKKYTIAVVFNNKKIGYGFGRSKKQAEERAALNALQKLGVRL